MPPHEEQLIREYIEPNPHKAGIDEAWIKEHGVPVWAIIGYLPAVRGDYALVARDYGVPVAAVEAAYLYYLRYQPIIDARIAANNGEVADIFHPV